MEQNIEIDLREVAQEVWKRIWIVVLCAVVVGASVLVYTVGFVTPQYQSSVTIYVNNNSNKNSTAISSSDLSVALRLVATYVNIIESDNVLDKVAQELETPLTASQIRGMLSAEAVGETEMFKVTITSPDPQLSAHVANAVATVAPNEIAAIIEGSTAKIIDYARVPTSKSSPNYLLNTVIGILLGAVGAVAVIAVKTVMDVRIKSEEDLAKICTVPVLGMIPNLAVDTKKTGGKARR